MRNELIKNNEALEQQNLEMKSDVNIRIDTHLKILMTVEKTSGCRNECFSQLILQIFFQIRTLRYKLSKLEQKVRENGDIAVYVSDDNVSSKKMVKYHGIAEEEITSLRQRAELDELRENLRIVVDENEALRKGMHEILDSIHDQDGDFFC